jgi:hypothetical protein
MTSPFNSPARIIEYAMKDAGLLQRGQLPDADQYAEYGNRLLDLINLWQTQGLKLWLQRDLAVLLTAGKGTYSLSPTGDIVMTKPMRVLQAYSLNTSGVKRPLTIISRDEYTRLSNMSQAGALNSLFVDKQQLALVLNFWLVPDVTAALEVAHVILQYQVTNFTTLTEGIEFPQEWFIALRWGLADDIATGQPQAIMDRCTQRAMAFKNALEDWDVEDASTMFQPDQRSYASNMGFR